MKRPLLIILFLFAASPIIRAQDKIHTTDGQVIECKILNMEREDGNLIYKTASGGDSTQQFIRPEAVKFIEHNGQQLVGNAWHRYEVRNMKYSDKTPELKNFYGITGGYSSSKTWTVSASYTRFFSRSSGLNIDLSYRNVSHPDVNYWGVGLMPSYEYHAFLQGMGSFLYMQLGLGAACYSADIMGGYRPRELNNYKTLALAAGAKVGFDVRLCKGLYLDIAAHIHWEPKAFDIGNNYLGGIVHPTANYGLQLGLRFGREQ